MEKYVRTVHSFHLKTTRGKRINKTVELFFFFLRDLCEYRWKQYYTIDTMATAALYSFTSFRKPDVLFILFNCNYYRTPWDRKIVTFTVGVFFFFFC